MEDENRRQRKGVECGVYEYVDEDALGSFVEPGVKDRRSDNPDAEAGQAADYGEGFHPLLGEDDDHDWVVPDRPRQPHSPTGVPEVPPDS